MYRVTSHRRVVVAILTGIVALCAWQLLPQMAAHSADTTKPEDSFVLKIFKLPPPGDFGAIRLNIKTGESWFGIIATGRQRWQKHEDPSPIQAGNYDIVVLVSDKGVLTARIDRITGSTWLIRDKTWTKVDEP